MKSIVTRRLPGRVADLLSGLGASPRLVAHLTVVHDVAYQLTQAIDRLWPEVVYDHQAVLVGAATHDIGKVNYPGELSGPGNQHEGAGAALLTEHDFPEVVARLARTHGGWAALPAPPLEALLVALADTAWRGERNHRLEEMVAEHLAWASGDEPWSVLVSFSDTVEAIAEGAEARLAWQAMHPV